MNSQRYGNSSPTLFGPNTGASSPIWRFFRRHVTVLLYLGFAFGGMIAVYIYFLPNNNKVANVFASSDLSMSAAIFKQIPDKPITQRLKQSPGPILIGIIAGHLESDSGAVCADGLTEAQITLNIAQQLSGQLQARGIYSEILAEFDPKFTQYSGSAIISIHADSCDYFNDLATGFKIAGSGYTDSQKLSTCVESNYAQSTQMAYHSNTITPHMTDYHVFREIPRGIPAMIIEVGFLNLDREMLTTNVAKPIEGLTNGILCFLEK